MRIRAMGMAVTVMMAMTTAVSCKKGPKGEEPGAPAKAEKELPSIREVCQMLQKRNRSCEKELVSRVRAMASKHLQLEPKSTMSLHGEGLKRMQRHFIEQWIRQSTREMTRKLFTTDAYFKHCAAMLRESREKALKVHHKAYNHCGTIRKCGPYVDCLASSGQLEPLQVLFADSNKARKADKVEPEGPWKVASFLLSMAVAGELFHCCLPTTRPSKTAQNSPQMPRTSGAPRCLAQIGNRPRRCAAELVAFAKGYVAKRLAGRPKAEQAALKKLLNAETGPDAVKRLQENTRQAVALMQTSRELPFGKICGSPKDLPAGFMKSTATIQAIGTCARHDKCKPYVACLAKMVQK